MHSLGFSIFALILATLTSNSPSRAWAGEPTKAQVSAAAANAVPGIPPELKDVGIFEKLGAQVAIQELSFTDEQGKSVKLADYFKSGRPVLLSLVYFGCPNLCTLVLDGMVKSLKNLDWTPGKEFEVVTVSIDSTEGFELASAKKKAYMESFGKPEGVAGWHFLTGGDSQIKKLASQVGFGYRYDAAEKQFAHSAAIFALTPEGKISRYLYGIDYPARDLKLALMEASSGKIGTVIDRFLLFCYRYDPKTRKYSFYLSKLMSAGGATTVVVFGGYLAVFWNRQRRQRRRPKPDEPNERSG